MSKAIVLSMFISLCFLSHIVFADDDSVLGAEVSKASDSSQSMPTADYHASIPQENGEGIKTIEEIKRGILVESGEAEGDEVSQPEKRGVKYYMNRFFNKNKDSGKTSTKGSVQTREAAKNKARSNPSKTKEKSKATSSVKPKAGVATSKKASSSAGSRIRESRSVQEQTQVDSKASAYHHF